MLKDHKALELDKILLQLANETTCPDAAELAQKIEPDTDIRHVERLLQETDDAFVLMAKYGAPSFYGMTNVTNALRRAEAGGVLNLAELLSVAATLRAIRSVSDWRKKSESVKTALDYRFETLQPNKFIEDRISMTVVSEEEVADTASVALAAIRRKIRAASLRVREQLDKMIRSQTYQKYLQEAIVTQRGGRYVVPVKAEFRNEVKGLIHDSSGSGATVFIEPIGVVEANNEIRVLRSDEKDEIDRILTELSREIGEFADGIIQSYRAAVELNLIFAKGQLAYKMKATVPKLNQEGRIAIKSARHPLIDKNKVVNHHQEVPFRVLERQYSFGEQGQHTENNDSENMIIHGDNLEALKALLPQYEGKVKCIYIVILTPILMSILSSENAVRLNFIIHIFRLVLKSGLSYNKEKALF